MTAVKTNPAAAQKKFDADIKQLEKLDPGQKAELAKIAKQADAQFKKEEDSFNSGTKTPPKKAGGKPSTGGKHPTSGKPSTGGKHPTSSKPSGSKTLLHGADTSMYQSNAQFQQSLKGAKWGAIKATEGKGWTDPTFASRWKEMGNKVKSGQMKLRVAYCFLDSGNGTSQAKHFLSTLGVKGKLPAGTRLALDWEGSALSDPNTLKQAADYVHKVTGTWPLVYCSASQVSRAKAAVPEAPTWEAEYGAGIKRGVPFMQYSDGPGFDHDVFEGNLQDLEKFAGDKVT